MFPSLSTDKLKDVMQMFVDDANFEDYFGKEDVRLALVRDALILVVHRPLQGKH